MNWTGQIFHLVKKDLLLEWRQKYALGGILLYVLSTVFLIYIILNQGSLLDRMNYKIWSVLFWVTLLFAAVNAVAKSFSQEYKERQLYYYSLLNPKAVIMGKMLYNLVLMLILTLLCFGVFALIIGNPVKTLWVFLLAIVLGGSGFSFLLTMVSAIASKANNNVTLMAILSFPIILPLLLLLQKLAYNAFIINQTAVELLKDVGVLLTFDIMIVVLSLILFPFLWRD